MGDELAGMRARRSREATLAALASEPDRVPMVAKVRCDGDVVVLEVTPPGEGRAMALRMDPLAAQLFADQLMKAGLMSEPAYWKKIREAAWTAGYGYRFFRALDSKVRCYLPALDLLASRAGTTTDRMLTDKDVWPAAAYFLHREGATWEQLGHVFECSAAKVSRIARTAYAEARAARKELDSGA